MKNSFLAKTIRGWELDPPCLFLPSRCTVDSKNSRIVRCESLTEQRGRWNRIQKAEVYRNCLCRCRKNTRLCFVIVVTELKGQSEHNWQASIPSSLLVRFPQNCCSIVNHFNIDLRFDWGSLCKLSLRKKPTEEIEPDIARIYTRDVVLAFVLRFCTWP